MIIYAKYYISFVFILGQMYIGPVAFLMQRSGRRYSTVIMFIRLQTKSITFKVYNYTFELTIICFNVFSLNKSIMSPFVVLYCTHNVLIER